MEPRISSPLVLGGVPGGRLAPPKVPSPASCCPPGPNSGCWEPPSRSGRGKEASAPGNCSLPSASSSSTHVGGRHGQGHQDGVPATAPALRDEATAPPAAPTRSPTELLDAVHVPKTHLTQGAEGRSWWTDVTGRGTRTRASCSHRLPGHRSLPRPEPRAPWTAARPAREPTNAAPTRSRCLAQPPFWPRSPRVTSEDSARPRRPQRSPWFTSSLGHGGKHGSLTRAPASSAHLRSKATGSQHRGGSRFVFVPSGKGLWTRFSPRSKRETARPPRSHRMQARPGLRHSRTAAASHEEPDRNAAASVVHVALFP